MNFPRLIGDFLRFDLWPNTSLSLSLSLSLPLSLSYSFSRWVFIIAVHKGRKGAIVGGHLRVGV